MLLHLTLLYLPAQILAPLFQLVAILTWTYWLEPATLGLVALIVTAQELAHMVFYGWFSAYTLRFFGGFEDDASRRHFLDTESIILVLAGIPVALGGFVLLAFIVDAPFSLTLTLIAVTFMVSRSITAHLAERARATERVLAYTLLQISGPVAGFLLGQAAIMLLAPSALLVLGGFAIAQSLAVLIALPMLGFSGRLNHPDKTILRSALKYGLPILLAGVFTWTALSGIRFIVEFIEGTAAVGLITVGLGLGLRAASFAAMLVTAAAFPLAIKAMQQSGPLKGQEQLVANGALLFTILAPTAGGLYALNSQVIHLLVGAEYREITLIILPLAIAAGAVRNLRIHFIDQIFLMFERPARVTLTNGIDAAATLILCTIGLLTHGLAGAVAGTLAGSIISAMTSFFLAAREHDFWLPAGHMLRISLATGIMILILEQFAPQQATTLFLCLNIALGMLVYAVALAVLYPRMARLAVTTIARSLLSLRTRTGPVKSSR
jgi:O-antigen/teichoic acid export membrane protein